MVPRKLRVRVALFCFAGNGQYSAITPQIASWLAVTQSEFDKDERVSLFEYSIYSDTPITMTRNLAVVEARKDGVDVLVMVDSDQYPDFHLCRPEAKPFMSTSFDFLYQRYDRGPHVVVAPYCGAPPTQVVFVFQWANWTDDNTEQDMRLIKYSRNHAAQLGGIQECAAGPTGLCMFDMRAFELTEPNPSQRSESRGWFYYEYTDRFASAKASTEDVTATRDISLLGCRLLGYNPVYCNWDAWAGHWKPICVGKPNPIVAEQVSHRFAEGVINDIKRGEQMMVVGDDDDPTPFAQIVAPPFDDLGLVTPAQDLAVLRRLVSECAPGKTEAARVIEVGSWVGASAIAMADAGAEVTCVDPWRMYGGYTDVLSAAYAEHGADKVYQTFLRNIGTRKDRSIHPLRKTSLDAAAQMKEQVDMVFIDANHDYDSVIEDIEAWLPHVRPGGIIAGHDYGFAMFPGVKQAVDELFPDGVSVLGTVWWTRKPTHANRLAPLSYPEFEEDVPEVIANGHAG